MPLFPTCGTASEPTEPRTTDVRRGPIIAGGAPDKARARYWTPAEVSAWVKDVGYPSYAELFHSNDIDGDALLEMRKGDFHDLTITSVGHIKTLMRKIDELNEIVSVTSSRRAPHVTSAIGEASSSGSSKRGRERGDRHSARGGHSSDSSSSHESRRKKKSSSKRHRDKDASYHERGRRRKAAARDSAAKAWRPPATETERKRDKDMYHHIWERVVGHREVMDERSFRSLNLALPMDTVRHIWATIMPTPEASRCSFDEFAAMLKLTSLAQMSVPTFVIRLDKLNEFHPKPPSMSLSATTTMEQSRQMAENMVAFVGVPARVLDRDDKLMQLEKHALRKFSPIHFEINGDVLVATFRSRIQARELEQLRWHTHRALKEMGFSSEHLASLTVRMPTAADLGTPDGGGMLPPTTGPTPGGAYPEHRATGGAYPPPPPYAGAIGAGKAMAAPQTYGRPVGSRPRDDRYGGGGAEMGGMSAAAHRPGSRLAATTSPMPPTGPTRSKSPMVLPTIITKAELAKMTRGDFWDEFCKRTGVEEEFRATDMIRTKSAIRLISKLRGVPSKQINFSDKGVTILSGHTVADLREALTRPTVSKIALLLNVNLEEFSDVYKGIEIEGLPEEVLARDETLHMLDELVLSSFEVLQIEVVGVEKLQIGFVHLITERDLDTLRKGLKGFLNDTLRVPKSVLKSVTILPHSLLSWNKVAEEAQMLDAMET